MVIHVKVIWTESDWRRFQKEAWPYVSHLPEPRWLRRVRRDEIAKAMMAKEAAKIEGKDD